MAEGWHTSANPQVKDESVQREMLEQTLDELLERYLILLDQYETQQAELSSNLASGFISLAQANFSNSNRIRYGRDFYDERMQASAQVLVTSLSPAFTLLERSGPPPNAADAETSKQSSRDPATWFGVLVSPALKASQRDFKQAVSSVPTLASLANDLKTMEIEVRRTRKRLSKLSPRT